MSTKLLLVRHGETLHNRQRIFQGQSGEGLSDEGREQAARLGARLARTGTRWGALYTSDLRRARETAEILGLALGLAPEPDPGLREVHLGAWELLHEAEIRERFREEWEAWRRGEDVRRGGGELLAEVGARMAAAVERILARHEGGSVLVVSHGAAIKSFVAHALSTTTLGLRPLRPVSNTGATLFERTPEGALSLLVYNDTAHLEDALAAALAPAPRAASRFRTGPTLLCSAAYGARPPRARRR